MADGKGVGSGVAEGEDERVSLNSVGDIIEEAEGVRTWDLG